MVSIKPISTIAKNIAETPFRKLSELGLMKKTVQYAQKDPFRFAAYSSLATLLAKDALGCYLYTTQSLKNEKIPAEKRKFVASLDLTNGSIMMTTQFLAFYLIDKNKKLHDWVFNKLFGRFFGEGSVKNVRQKLNAHTAQTKVLESLRTADKYKYWQSITAAKKACKGGIGFFLPLVAAILAKRMITPLIATPLADKVKKHWLDGTGNSNQDTKIYEYSSYPEVYSKFLKQSTPSSSGKS